jgi:hypothetical protein
MGLTGVIALPPQRSSSAVCARFAIQAFSMAIANKISATAMSTNRAKVCIYLRRSIAPCFGPARGFPFFEPNF